MKILDASALIAILYDLGRPDLIDKLLELGHELAVAGHVAESELRSRETKEGIKRLVRQGKIRILVGSTAAELQKIKKTFPSLGLGECDTLLSYEKVRPRGRSYCILDDRGARLAAKSMGIPFTGLLGLLSLLKDRGIISECEASAIVKDLRRAGFWMPANVVI